MTVCARKLKWPDGRESVFDLGAPWPAANYELMTGRTFVATMKSFEENSYSAGSIREVLNYGLIGGGRGYHEANALIEKQMAGQPLAPFALMAYAVMSGLFVGAAEEAEG